MLLWNAINYLTSKHVTYHKTWICINITVRALNLVVITSYIPPPFWTYSTTAAAFTSYGSEISWTNRCRNHISCSATLLTDGEWHTGHHTPDMMKQDLQYLATTWAVELPAFKSVVKSSKQANWSRVYFGVYAPLIKGYLDKCESYEF